MNTALQASLTALEYSRNFTNTLLAAIPADKYCYQPIAGANHALWIMGHLASIDAALLQMCGGPADARLPTLQPIFFMQSQPLPEPASYPPIAEVRTWFEETREALLTWYRGQDEQQLLLALPEPVKGIAPDRLHLVPRLAVHEATHAGQLTVIRKSLGLAPVFA